VAKFSVLHESTITPAHDYPAPFTGARGVREARRVSPDGYATWLVRAELDDGAVLTWGDVHGDEGVYVVAGALDVDGRRCPADGAVILEAGAPCEARAVGATSIVHVGPYAPDPPTDGLYGAPRRHAQVHVVGPGGWYASGDRESVIARWFADSTCPSCRISFFHVARTQGGVKDLPHTHTQDELIYVLDGSIVFAREEHGPGTVFAIPANVRYSVTSGPNGMAFLNYRPDVSTQAYGKAKPPELEGGIARGGVEVADLR
jgi:mannose-6-phosphate isomerase-like protein (cupin superfamily)